MENKNSSCGISQEEALFISLAKLYKDSGAGYNLSVDCNMMLGCVPDRLYLCHLEGYSLKIQCTLGKKAFEAFCQSMVIPNK
jgi:hypothetical protein